ncbi:MAG: HesA/MoeB/ThiF family protein [Desulfobacterales bacterium]|nr:HesA/MoeB/ThiF family protein [Desulfobacterales bacterium]
MGPEMHKKISDLINEKSKSAEGLADPEIKILLDESAHEIADECNCRIHDVYLGALEKGIYPYRYIRNREIISVQEQLKLAQSKVSVIGAGGLGGQVILLLARLGIGHLVIVDHDVFDETNLNRQALSNMESLGKPKAEQAVRVLGSINPSVIASSYPVKLDQSNASEILSGSKVVVDALDNVPDRFVLEKAAKKLGIPLVHGALAGFEGQLMTIFPDDQGLKSIYGEKNLDQSDSLRPERVLGTPGLTASLISTLQAMEVLKIILPRGKIFKNIMLHADLESGRLSEFLFSVPKDK